MPYTLHHVNVSKGDQFKPEFLAISPNNKFLLLSIMLPLTVVSHSHYESGAILIYLAEKSGKCIAMICEKKMITAVAILASGGI